QSARSIRDRRAREFRAPPAGETRDRAHPDHPQRARGRSREDDIGMADEKKTKKTDEETPVEEKPKRTRKKAEDAGTPEAEAKPKRTRKKAEETAAEPAEAPVVAEEIQAEAEQVEAQPEAK